jgi:UDP-2,3-diacylglucosamine hydrolase
MDANGDAIATLLREHGYPCLIHGHTHRPACHQLMVDGHKCERWVLADWRESAGKASGEVLVWADGYSPVSPLSDDSGDQRETAGQIGLEVFNRLQPHRNT